MKRQILTYLVAWVLLAGCADDAADPVIEADDLDLTIAYEAAFDNALYPSYILGLANYSNQSGGYELIEVSFKNPREDYKLRIELDASAVNEATTLIESYTGIDETETFYFEPNWDYEGLRALSEPGNVNLTFSAYIDDELIDTQTLKLGYRSVNECVYFINNNSEFVDLAFMFSAYVNEDNSLIDQFLSEAKSYGTVSNYKAYQGTDSEVFNEVFSIWYNLQKNEVEYSNITETSNASDIVGSQYVRFFEEVYNNSGANCVDGSVFISSILMKLGIDPVLILVPGHMYMGFYTDAANQNFYVLETTMVGDIDVNSIKDDNTLLNVLNSDPISPFVTQADYDNFSNGSITIEELRQIISYNQFLYAVDYRANDYTSEIDKFNDSNEIQYQVFNLTYWRQFVQPI